MVRERRSCGSSALLGCGAVAAPLFIAAFTAIGAGRQGYDWRRHPVSSLAIGRGGWTQRGNFVLAGLLYSCGAVGLARCRRRDLGPSAVPVLVAAVGVALIGSGMFVTDPVGDYPPASRSGLATRTAPAPTLAGRLHNVSAIPIFAGVPLAGLLSAVAAVRRGDYGWACSSAASSLTMAGSFLLFGAAFGGTPRLAGTGGVFQRVSIAAGFGWLTALFLRARHRVTTVPRR